jgi:hypothetical protein
MTVFYDSAMQKAGIKQRTSLVALSYPGKAQDRAVA